MTKEFVVNIGKDVYKRNCFNREVSDKIGAILFPKVVGFSSTINAIINRQFIENENHFSIYKCLKDIFNEEDIQWLIKETLYNLEEPISFNGRYFMTEDEVDEHFAGKFLLKASIVFQMVYQNLGELKDLIPNMKGLPDVIGAYLNHSTKVFMNQMEQSLNIYEANEAKEKKQKKTSGKK